MNQPKGILIFNRDNPLLNNIGRLLKGEDILVFATGLPLEAIHIIQNNDIDIVLTNEELEGMDAREFRELAEKIRPGINIFMVPFPSKEGREIDCTINTDDYVRFMANHVRIANRLLNESYKFKEFFFSFVDRLLQVLEVNDRYFFNNNHLVASLSCRMAEKMGLDERHVDAIRISAFLRDIGRVGIQHDVVDEKRQLGREEFSLIKSHPVNTVRIFNSVEFPWKVMPTILHHHEHYDGNGYPEGLSGREIPLGSRIISVVDSYVAMTTDRPHRKALSREEAVNEIMRKTGTQFDPEVVEAFLSVIDEEGAKHAEKRSILVMDHDDAISAMVRLGFQGKEFDIITTKTISEATQSLREKHPSIIIADAGTLSMDKFHFYNIVRQDNKTNGIPFIMVVPDKDIQKQTTDPGVHFLMKPLDVEELGALLKRISDPYRAVRETIPQRIPEEIRGVSGNLEDLSLVDIMQVLNLGLKTAKVLLMRDGEKGLIYMESGKVVYVSTGDLTGHEAFYELMSWSSGQFRILHGQKTEEVNVTLDTMNLLLESSRVMDERRRKNLS